jgi:transcriptional repressor NrdR
MAGANLTTGRSSGLECSRRVRRIEKELRQLRKTEVESSIVGEKVMRELKEMDEVAYIRFASVYREFADITDFQKELSGL